MSSRLRRILRGLGLAALVPTVACQDRPIGWSTPERIQVTIDQSVQYVAPKIDLLFVIDNTGTMADKHTWLGPAIVRLVERLINPPCLDGETRQPVATPDHPREPCESGTRLMTPVRDLHLGFITTSLGGHGHPIHCEAPESPAGNDRAHLLPTVRGSNVETYRDQGFFAWDDQMEVFADPLATRDLGTLRESILAVVDSAGTGGCGLEAPLEAWYRFLIDPSPPAQVVVENGRSVKRGIDHVLLEFGYCYIDPDQGAGDDRLVAFCPSSERRDLRFLGEETPRNGATVLMACVSQW